MFHYVSIECLYWCFRFLNCIILFIFTIYWTTLPSLAASNHLSNTVSYFPLHRGQIAVFLRRFLCSNIAAAAKSLQSCLTLCDPIDGSPPGTAVPGILQARTLEWVATSFSNAWKWKVKVKSFSRVRLLATPWTAAYQAPPSMGFSRQEYWSGVPLPSPIDIARDHYSVFAMLSKK